LKEDADAMEELAEEMGGSENVTDEDIEERAIAPIKPIIGLMESYANLASAMDYIGQLERANEKLSTDEESDQDAVVIGTIHSWKGLEVPNMYVPIVRGKFPRGNESDEDMTEEELGELDSDRRLAYVAITRAENKCVIFDIPNPNKPDNYPTNRFINEACVAYTDDIISGKISSDLYALAKQIEEYGDYHE
jgi:DNA helicase-2/ATP-dependent DNA helicase PcrA